MKKITSILLILTLLFTFCSCASGDNQASTDTPDTASSPAFSPETLIGTWAWHFAFNESFGHEEFSKLADGVNVYADMLYTFSEGEYTVTVDFDEDEWLAAGLSEDFVKTTREEFVPQANMQDGYLLMATDEINRFTFVKDSTYPGEIVFTDKDHLTLYEGDSTFELVRK